MAVATNAQVRSGRARLLGACALLLACFASACNEPPANLAGIDDRGELRVGLLPPLTTRLAIGAGARGYERDLARGLAEHLGVRARFVTARNPRELLELVRSGKVHLAAGLPTTALHLPADLALGPSYRATRHLVIQRRDGFTPRSRADLRGRRMASAGAVQRPVLEQYLPRAMGFDWVVHGNRGYDELLERLAGGTLDAVVMPSGEYAALAAHFPDTRVAFGLGPASPIAWVQRADAPDLFAAELAYLRELRADGGDTALLAHHFGEVPRVAQADAPHTFRRHYEQRLPRFREAFRSNAQRYHLDWLLLAAMAYQESHWRADARSPTGVRGLMMLTERTARALRVNRLDPGASIRGGARYFDLLLERLPATVAEPDRTWLALAAYNLGPGALDRARHLARRAGADADSWTELRRFLPQARAGWQWSRRGRQAVAFVERVRHYHALLQRLEAVSGRTLLAAGEAGAVRNRRG